jgi:Trk-type K+ transport system membrane component
MSILILSGSFGFIVWFDLLNWRRIGKVTASLPYGADDDGDFGHSRNDFV